MNQHLAAHAWDADDNKPVIPKIPRPRPALHAPTELDAACDQLALARAHGNAQGGGC
ncbi:hypothetical protein [Streptomyces sp. G1]|uniref:hypothetical protein n=1 Tax=Streptomyces sp. G1 TaxID=361572 RepID=UPI00202F74C5|nr:hypothetical protein [Streptomyces sp. G1]MCM1972301.1 hypothetical protein [Streptomyces sp. G1]